MSNLLTEYWEAKNRVSNRLFANLSDWLDLTQPLGNILGVGVGYKNGDPNRGLSLRIYVRKKLPPELVPVSLLFKGLFEGLEVDVVQMRPLIAFAGTVAAVRGPAIPGSRIRLTKPGGARVDPGCLGAVLEDAAGKRYALSANHVLSQNQTRPDAAGFKVHELGPPGPVSLPPRQIGTRVFAPRLENMGSVDCAMVELEQSVEVRQQFPPALNVVSDVVEDLGFIRRAAKFGPDGELKEGTSLDRFVDVQLTYTEPLPSTIVLRDLTLIDDGTPKVPDQRFAAGGHSGAVVFQFGEDNLARPAGLLVGGPRTDLDLNDVTEDYTAVCSLRAVMQALEAQGPAGLHLAAPGE